MEFDEIFSEFTQCRCDGMRLKATQSEHIQISVHNFLQTLGNHEFDHGVEGVAPFVDTVEAPLTLANIDVSLEPSLQGKLPKSIVLTRNGRQIGIIGVINRFTYVISVCLYAI